MNRQMFETLAAWVEKAPPEDLPAGLSALAAIQGQIAARLLEGRARGGHADRWLTANEAAELTGLRPRWFYERAKELPFARRPSPRRLRFDEAGLIRWMQGQKRAGQ